MLLTAPDLRLSAAWLLDASPSPSTLLPAPAAGPAGADVLVVGANHRMLLLTTGGEARRRLWVDPPFTPLPAPLGPIFRVID